VTTLDKLEMVRCAIAEIGDVSAAELSAYLEQKYGVRIQPAFIPVYKATLKCLETTKKVDAALAPSTTYPDLST
jgi:hypothetical protein